MTKFNRGFGLGVAFIMALTPISQVFAVEVTPPGQPMNLAPVTTEEAITTENEITPQWNDKIENIQITDIRGMSYVFQSGKIFKFLDNPVGGAKLLQMDERELNKAFQEMSSIFDVKGREADIRISKKGELESLTKEIQPILFNREQVKSDLIGKIKSGDFSPYELSYQFGPSPKKTEGEMKKINSLLGEYSTRFNSSEEQRTGNISLGASYINGKVLMPGEEFSFLNTAGPLTMGRGYKNAKIIQDGEFVDGIAGGACQVSTTLFNAVLKSGLKVSSRRNHSLAIAYVPRGMDAAVASGLDFRFVNNLSSPVYIQAFVEKSTLTMKIYGNVKDYREVKISVKNTGERKYTLTRTINGVNDYFYSSYGVKKAKAN